MMVVAVVVKDTEHMAKSAISMRQPSNGYAGMHTLNKNKKMFSQHPSYASAPTKLSRGHSLMSVLPVANAKLATPGEHRRVRQWTRERDKKVSLGVRRVDVHVC